MSDDRLTLFLFSRPECHLCDEFIIALEDWQKTYHFDIEVINIDDDTALTERYAARIPILTCGDIEICQYFPETELLQQFLEHRAIKKQPD